jgi:acyl-CoA dehydrogenase
MTGTFVSFDFRRCLGEAEAQFVEYATEVIQKRIAPLAEEFDQSGEFPWASIKVLNELGMNGVFLPAEYGGTPLSYSAYLQLVEQLSCACPATAITWATTFHAVAPIVRFGTSEQKRRFLPRIAEGALAAVAISEHSGGSDATSMKSTLTRHESGDLILHGSKVFITNGDVADVIVVFARCHEFETPRKQLSCVIVERDNPGLTVAGRERKLGHRASSTAELRFDNCRVPASSVLGELGEGFPVLLSMLNRSRPSVSAQAIGIAMAAFAETQRYVNERRQFGQRILDFQGVQFMMADMATSLATVRSWLRHIGALIDADGGDYDVEASMLKVAASDAAMNICTQAVQLQGGHGYMTGSKVERLFRDAKVTQIWEGANELHRARIGRSFLSMPATGR